MKTDTARYLVWSRSRLVEGADHTQQGALDVVLVHRLPNRARVTGILEFIEKACTLVL